MNFKKGMLIYDYKNLERINETNVGDYVQTLAALEIVNEDWKTLVQVNREELFKKPKNLNDEEKVKVICNGWFTHNQETWPVNKSVHPLFTSVHISKGFSFNEQSISELKKFQPIGCRDLDSMRRLNEQGIDAYFSGCLTMAMKPRNVERNGILFVVDNIKFDEKGNGNSTFVNGGITSYDDFLKWKGSKYIIKELKKQFSKDEIEKAEFASQFRDKNLPIKSQFEYTEKWLEKISKKELVVTTRIHTLMPSMAMGTPALFIMINNKDLRFKGLSDYWNFIDFSDNDKFNINIHTKFQFKNKPISKRINRKNGKIVNNESFRKFIESETLKIREWWNK